MVEDASLYRSIAQIQGRYKRMNNKGLGFIEIFIIILLACLYLLAARVDGAEMNGIPEDAHKIKFTCYCPESCPGKVTASGEPVREGIIAASKEHLGDGAMIYLKDGTFLGYFECLDTGGSPGIKSGHVIDVWTPHLAKAKTLMRVTQGEVYILWIKSPRG